MEEVTLTEREKEKFAREDFEAARELAKKKGASITNEKDSFLFVHKLPVYSRKRYRGFIGYKGIIMDSSVLYLLVVGFRKNNDVPFAFNAMSSVDINEIFIPKRRDIIKILRGITQL